MLNDFTQILEALLFASGSPRKRSEILDAFTGRVTKKELDKACEELMAKYSHPNGIILVQFNDKIQLTTNPKYGEIVAEVLTPLKEKELSRVLLEVLAIIAYKQPLTRLDIEKIKGTSAEYALSVLLKADLIEVIGRKDVVGRPALYATTDEFLKKFQMTNIQDLPDFQAVLDKLESMGEYNKSQVGLYRDVDIQDESEQASDQERIKEIERALDPQALVDEILQEEEEIPDFLKDGEYEIVE